MQILALFITISEAIVGIKHIGIVNLVNDHHMFISRCLSSISDMYLAGITLEHPPAPAASGDVVPAPTVATGSEGDVRPRSRPRGGAT